LLFIYMMKTTAKILSVTLLSLFASCSHKPDTILETVKAERGELTETVTATGTIESVTQVDVGTQVTGIIDKLYADYNTVVTKGQLIAEIEKTLLQSDLTSAEANVESARLTYEYNLVNYNRDKALHDKQLISDYEFQTSKKELEVSKTAYDKAKADKVRAAKNLNYAEIYSPIDGIVISREVEVGQTVVSNMNVANLYTIADLDNMQVIGNVDEADIGQVKVGQAVTFSVDAYSDELFEGHVTQVRLNPTVESNVVTYEVVVAAPNPDHKLIPGLTANLIIYTMSEDNVLLLPTKAFMFTPQINDDDNLPKPDGDAGKLVLGDGQKCVWVVKDGRLVPTVVTVGASNGLKTVIHEGLSDNDAVASGYSVSAGSQEGERSEGERSPFAPQPPGRNKKK
ncbi:efflux RND transporter periplasmic adaptor subunit, partial [uncultured Duncaniella sp.]